MTTTDRRHALGCLLGSFEGTEAPAWLLDAVRDGLGGVLLFADNVVDDAQVNALCARLRSARPDVIVAIDEEGGDVTRLDARRASDVPSPAAFGFVDDVELTEQAFAALGSRLHALGIDLTLAPVADVNSNPQNPIIGVRSFGSDASLVSRHVAAAVRGFRSGGVCVAAKHFPGHGDTNADTHLGTAVLDASLDVLDGRELLPFRAAIDDGAEAVLTAHIVATALDDQPVSLSAAWTRHLRDAMGFDGVVVTDALDMDGVAGGRGVAGVADAAVRALDAGADLLCLGSKFDAAMTETVVDAVVAAIDEGRFDRDDLRRRGVRVATLLGRSSSVGLDATTVAVATGAGAAAARHVADAAISIDGTLPPGPYTVLECRPRLSMASFNVVWGVAGALAEHGWPTQLIGEGDALPPIDGDAGSGSVLVVVRDLGVHPWQRDVIEHCLAAGAPTVVAELGWPSRDALPDAIAASVVTRGASRASADALVARLTRINTGVH